MRVDFVRRAKPRITWVNPQFWRGRFNSWAQSDVIPITALLSALERRAWPLKDDNQLELVQLVGPELELLKREIARRVHQDGGRVNTGSMILESSDGLTFNARLPFSI